MLHDLIHWFSSLPIESLFLIFPGVIFFDTPRYVLTTSLMCLYDGLTLPFSKARTSYEYCPSLCVIISCLNEGHIITKTLKSIWGTYPNLEIIVVDDGSKDNTYEVSSRFARTHSGVKVLRNRPGTGKALAVNYALNFTNAEIILNVDSDSDLGKDALWLVAQPFSDPKVGGVSATIVARNPFENMVTWCQAYQYLCSILVGRIFSSKLGILCIASGAFSAFRRNVVAMTMGLDSSPGEDFDLTIKVRRSGYKIVFVPEAECYTDVPTMWISLFKQRMRWDRSIVKFKLGKYANMSYFWYNNFRFSDFVHWVDTITYSLIFCISFWIYVIYYAVSGVPNDFPKILVTLFLIHMGVGVIQALVICFYSNNIMHDLKVCLISPLYIFFAIYLKFVTLCAIVDEVLFTGSRYDPYVPKHVRDVLIRW